MRISFLLIALFIFIVLLCFFVIITGLRQQLTAQNECKLLGFTKSENSNCVRMVDNVKEIKPVEFNCDLFGKCTISPVRIIK